MKRFLLSFILVLTMVLIFAFSINAEEITVVDGTDEIIYSDCIIEGLNVEIPPVSKGFTFALDTVTLTAKVKSWAYSKDAVNGRDFVLPSYVTYNGDTYTVIGFSAVGAQNSNNKSVVSVFIPDTVVSIPNNAFDDCRAIKHVYVGSGVETIGKACFRNAGFTASSDMDTVTETEMGNIENFIWKTTKITTLSESCFFHLDFLDGYNLEFAFENITKFEASCMAYNTHAFQDGHKFNKQLFIDKIDLRNVEVEKGAFDNAALAQTIIINADQIHLVNINFLRGSGTNRLSDTYFVIYGGETKEEAITLTNYVWTQNAWYWYPATYDYYFYFKGYVKAYDGADGLLNQNGYGIDVIDYFFESNDALDFYLNSVKTTTSAEETYTRYAKNKFGYFNVCNGDGTSKAYNLVYEEQVYTLVELTTEAYIKNPATHQVILDGKCTPSTLCMVCDTELEKGLDHDIVTTVTYENGFLTSGTKNVFCQREECKHENITTVNPIFTFKGYSVNEDETELCVGYFVDNTALDEYNLYNQELVYGFVVTIINDGEALTLSYDNGVKSNLDNTAIVEIDSVYAGFDFKLSGFKDKQEGDLIDTKSLNLVMSAYAYDGTKINYLGSPAVSNYCDTTPQIVTFNQISTKSE